MDNTRHSWYAKCMPRVMDVQPHLTEIVKDLSKINGLRNLYVWGSYAHNIDSPSFRLRNIDLLAHTRFFSGDLLAIDNDVINNPSSEEDLENLGYDPQCVSFSKEFIKLAKYNINHWAISSDRKLMHWGAISENKTESVDINNDASEYATKETGIKREKINIVSETTRQNWYKHFCHYLDYYFKDMPYGWYKMEDIKIRDLLEGAIKIK
jgi:hypothetical protein